MKYGEGNFEFEVIDHADTIDELNQREAYWIAYYKSTDRSKGYNLDSGGKNCIKSEETRILIGQSTTEKWANPEIAKAMRAGLQKGTEAWKNKCKNNRILFVCPICNKEELLPPHLADKIYCSNACRKTDGKCKEVAMQASKIAAQKAHEKNANKKSEIASDIINWAKDNSELIFSCPKNKITSTLAPLLLYIQEKYDLKDMRSLFLCFDVKNKKEFLLYLQSKLVEENIC